VRILQKLIIMKKIIFFITLLFLSFSIFSASNVYTLQGNTALRLDNTSKSKLLKTLSKDTQLQRLTMHYSGWSQVILGSLQGWILSDQLTKTAPKNNVNMQSKSNTKAGNNKHSDQIENLEEFLEKLQLENKDLSSKIVYMKALNAESTTKITTDLSALQQQNTALSTYNNDLQGQIDSTDTDNNINTLFTFIFGLIIGFIISIVIARLAQKKRDSFNSISRSY
jgi:SH3 domain protein